MKMFQIAAAAAAGDILIKQYVEENLPQGEDRVLPGGCIILRKVYNNGAACNFLESRPRAVLYLSAALTGILLVRDLWLLRRRGHFAEKTGMMLLTGGAASNLFDRVFRGRVVDYIAFRVRCRKLSDLTFNLGDFCIFSGAALAVLGSLGKSRQKKGL